MPETFACDYRKGMEEGPDHCRLMETVCWLETGDPCECLEVAMADARFDIACHDQEIEEERCYRSRGRSYLQVVSSTTKNK